MKKLLVLCCLALSLSSHAQVTQVFLQASGLTCSMCSRSIYKALKTLDFVDSVEANIKNSTFNVTVRPGATADFDQVKQMVEDAGFSVTSFTAMMKFDNVQAQTDVHVTVDGRQLHFLNSKQQVLNGNKMIRVLDKGFVSSKEFKKNKGFTKMKCYETGVAGECCTQSGVSIGTRMYHVVPI
jgi:copper chaperone CopZ